MADKQLHSDQPSHTSSSKPTEQEPEQEPLKPSLKFRIASASRTLAILLAGVGVVYLGLAIRDLASIAKENTERNDCISQINAQLSTIQADVNATGWAAVISSFTHPRPPQTPGSNSIQLPKDTQDKIDHLNQLLTIDLPRAVSDRRHALDICSNISDSSQQR